MDRLLSEQEIDSCQENNFYDRDGELSIPKLLKAQGLKTAQAINAEWVEWIKKHRIRNYNKDGEYYYGSYPTIIIVTPEEWRERKKEIGL